MNTINKVSPKRAHRMGKQCAKYDLGRDDNPFVHGSVNHKQWNEGYDHENKRIHQSAPKQVYACEGI